MSGVPVIEIDMDRRCTVCGRKGTTKSGLCLKCVADRVVATFKAKLTQEAK